MEELLSSSGRQRSLEAAYTRVRDQCLHCRYYGACDGEPVTEKLTESPDIYKNGVRECIVEKSTISYIIDKIRQAELVDDAGYLVPLQ
jgi:sulfatase maturation enzyme AslB (radical SAM superfamily)